ncbi:MAG TPA: ABC-2 transporter permease [Candidatus Scatomorpha merdipullorum]|uniref:ABC-2 transporter permease n=1 Tax=Candidatus Scatomorpha merdipullorum TaxID=2840927 RepID=A0A9D1FD27_9FIRM|nr:ABC-2 transporter permease [Candidatus Scatomorpha merdipullorum]
MKALLVKDLLTLKGQAKSLLLVLAVWFIISFVNGSGLFFTSLSVIYGMLLPLTTLSIDEKSRVERYMMSMPVTRAELALSRYALGLLGLLALGVLGIGASLVIGDSLEEALGASAACFCLAVLLLGVTLPLVYKFGTDKARVVCIAVYMVTFLAVSFIAARFGIELDDLSGAFFLLPFLSLAVLALSAAVSLGIYKKREF